MHNEQKPPYENNPFLIGLNGLKVLFKKAQPIAIMAIVLAVIGIGSNRKITYKQTYSDWQGWVGSLTSSDVVVISLLVATVVFIVAVIGLIIRGMFDFTSAQIVHGKDTTLGAAFNAATSHIGSFLWLQVLIGIKILLWSLLFIIPGIIMSVRYSLAGVSFFESNKRGNEAIKHSLSLTRGAWLTTFASKMLWNLMTFGFVEQLLSPGTNALLYRQFMAYEKTNESKPRAHFLSWLTLFIPFIVVSLLMLIIVVFVISVDTNGFS